MEIKVTGMQGGKRGEDDKREKRSENKGGGKGRNW